MNLHDHLERDLHARVSQGDCYLDVARLGRVARTQGTRVLRRRRAVAVVAGVSAVTVAAVGVSAVPHGAGDGARDLVAAGVSNSRSNSAQNDFDPAHPGPTGPATGRGLAAALRWAVADLQDGSATNFGGQEAHEWYANLEWTSADGQGVSVIGVNVQNDMRHGNCDSTYLDCRESTLSDGSLLMTFEEHTAVADGTGISRTADLMRSDGVRVVVSATNGFDLPSSQWDITRPQPPLSAAQLTRLAQEPFWGATLPTYFLEQGRDLQPYEALGTSWPDRPVSSSSASGG